ncbi:hypothetical protein CGMCC3_g10782 [Colletotrichum fructicola]|nr:uncharacterized protein CGMCC3_g10782 [Colletotrichum fructicola]KAE9573139.1 hypothetical protein CGMCC3_g10782 [Colletotrichum fructicola]
MAPSDFCAVAEINGGIFITPTRPDAFCSKHVSSYLSSQHRLATFISLIILESSLNTTRKLLAALSCPSWDFLRHPRTCAFNPKGKFLTICGIRRVSGLRISDQGLPQGLQPKGASKNCDPEQSLIRPNTNNRSYSSQDPARASHLRLVHLQPSLQYLARTLCPNPHMTKRISRDEVEGFDNLQQYSVNRVNRNYDGGFGDSQQPFAELSATLNGDLSENPGLRNYLNTDFESDSNNSSFVFDHGHYDPSGISSVFCQKPLFPEEGHTAAGWPNWGAAAVSTTFEPNPNEFEPTASSNQQYPCPACTKFKGEMRILREHMRCHIRPFGCPKASCGQSFSTKRDLERHDKTLTKLVRV